jgi:HK97 family phage major capsid protein/HK97 family phage prohead protease
MRNGGSTVDPENEDGGQDGAPLVEIRRESIGPQVRNEVIDLEACRAGEDASVFTFSFSSETPVERYNYDEVLSHKSAAVDLSRLNNAAPLLWNHDPNEMLGVVDRAWIEGSRGYVSVRFGSSPKAQEVLADVRAKIIRNVSVGYRILEVTETKFRGRNVLTATKWRPSEVSIVSVPADQSVGLGRADEEASREVPVLGIPETRKEAPVMDPVLNTPVDVGAVRSEAVTAERDRASAIRALGERLGNTDLANSLVNNGTPLDQARQAFLEIVASRAAPVVEGAADLDLTANEQRNYSLVRAINAQVSGNWDSAGFERECSVAIAQRAGKDTAGFFMPMNIRMGGDAVRAPYAVGAAGTGGNLVATDLMAGSFIDLIRNRARVAQLGARFLSGLVGNVAIPRQITGSTAYWVAEAGAVTESEGTFDLVSLSPKTLGARSQMTRQQLAQGTPDIEALARADLAATIALAIDLAATSGSGASNQPLGILNTSGIGSVVGGTNGATITIDHLIDLETAVANTNADVDNMSYLTNSKVVGKLKKAVSSTGQYLWTNTAGGPGGSRGPTPGEINGYGVARSNQITSTGTKGTASGVCSTVLFGNFADLIIGEWGVLEILANPYGAGYNSGSVDIRAMQSLDLAVRHKESFAAMTDALTV